MIIVKEAACLAKAVQILEEPKEKKLMNMGVLLRDHTPSRMEPPILVNG